MFLGSLYVTATVVKKRYLKLIICISIVMSMYSLRYFYHSLPGSDALTVQGLAEYAITTGDLDPSKTYHWYFQWPLFFILNQISNSITGLETVHFEFVLFTILGVLYVASLYVYASRFSRDGSYIAVIAYFIIMYWLLNYQFAPFSLAMGLLYTLFMLETNTLRKREIRLATMILFISITLVHPFAAALFMVYTLAMYIASRKKSYVHHFLFALVVYLAVSIYSATIFFTSVVKQLTGIYLYEYLMIVEMAFSGRVAPAPPIDTIAQAFSRIVGLSIGVIAGLGFLFLLLKRKLRRVDFAVFISMALYAAVAAVFPLMGRRTFFALLIPISLGTTYFYKTKFQKQLKCFFLVLVILFPFIPLTQSFYDAQIFFWTEEEYRCANFAISYCNWTEQSSILSHFRLMRYLQTKTASGASFGDDLSPSFPANVGNYKYIVYTAGLGKNLLLHDSLKELSRQSRYNTVFNSGFSYVIVKTNSS